MSRRPSGESGFTLIELLIVSSLFLVVLGATLTSFNSFERSNRQNNKDLDQVEVARASMDRASRQLRNLARRIDTSVIKRATADDLVFQTSDPSKRWVRYCLKTTSTPPVVASPSRGRLMISQSSGATVTEGMLAACPGTGWTQSSIAADHVTNANRAVPEPIFTYTCTGAADGCPRPTQIDLDSTRLKNISMNLLIDREVTKSPPEMRVASGVFLRNQNEPPTARFVATSLGPGKVLLNGTESTDPEGRTLRYFFFKGTVPEFTCLDGPPATAKYFVGIAPTYTFTQQEVTAAASGTGVDFTLVVCDPGDLKSVSATQNVKP